MPPPRLPRHCRPNTGGLHPLPSVRTPASRLALLLGLLALTACGGNPVPQATAEDAPAEQHTVLLEATSDYGWPMQIMYYGHTLGPKGLASIGGANDKLTAESPWKVSVTVAGKDPWVLLSANGSGCIGPATGGDSCETGSIPNRKDIVATGTVSCRITIDGKVVVERSYTWPTIIPVTCLTGSGEQPK
ncbi:hypothetical protein [Kitasatospora sp. NPDC002040]|uniref:hypothetical protein n=1 Tax=Kitasatospora sp. NPDC002040 TaxID=3154661 RepID=UPI003329DAD4